MAIKSEKKNQQIFNQPYFVPCKMNSLIFLKYTSIFSEICYKFKIIVFKCFSRLTDLGLTDYRKLFESNVASCFKNISEI